jgi:hypothetical protein
MKKMGPCHHLDIMVHDSTGREIVMEYGMQQSNAQVVETASATTSPDNVNSGSRPYLIAAASLIALVLAFMMMGGCAAMTMKSLYYLVEDDILSGDYIDYMGDEGYTITFEDPHSASVLGI